jgi:outer membrane protein OmpA-like peptidoglycan-associated protein
MKKNFVLLAALAALTALFLSCAGEPVKTTGNAVVDGLNVSLAKVPIEGFPSGKPASKEEWNKMINIAVPVVREVMPKIPAGYNLQVTGHTDGEGGVKSADNFKLSAERAKSVWDELRKRGIKDGKLTYKGVAGTIKTGKCGLNSACQRRVTFMVVPK